MSLAIYAVPSSVASSCKLLSQWNRIMDSQSSDFDYRYFVLLLWWTFFSDILMFYCVVLFLMSQCISWTVDFYSSTVWYRHFIAWHLFKPYAIVNLSYLLQQLRRVFSFAFSTIDLHFDNFYIWCLYLSNCIFTKIVLSFRYQHWDSDCHCIHVFESQWCFGQSTVFITTAFQESLYIALVIDSSWCSCTCFYHVMSFYNISVPC